jgi:hypothetical protein
MLSARRELPTESLLAAKRVMHVILSPMKGIYVDARPLRW